MAQGRVRREFILHNVRTAPLLALLALALALALAAASYVALRRYARDFLRPRGRRSERTPASIGLDARQFEATSAEGRVRGWLLRAGERPRPTVLLVHGWQSHAGDMLLWAEPLVRAGYHAVVYDALGHGESDPSEFTSIRHLREDLEAVLAWTLAQPEAAPGVVLFGHSMGGAATILVAAAGAPVRALVTAGAPTDPLEITIEFLDGRGLPGAALVRLLRPFWQPIVGEPYERLRPEMRMAEVRVPTLVLHGGADRQVPSRHAERLAARNARARLAVLDGGDHMNLPQHPRYAATVVDFLAEVFAPHAANAGGPR